MDVIRTISLNVDWTCDYFEDRQPSLYEFMETHPVPMLRQWSFERRLSEGWTAWLQRRFDLPPIGDSCIDYRLQIEDAPSGAQLVINGREFGEVKVPTTIDVTDVVTLEDNQIAFRVPCDASGAFGNIRLIALPCDSYFKPH
jgi:hypothetical protein